MHRFSRTIVAIGVAALLVGCGSDKPKIDTSKVLTKAQYIQASDDICNEFGKQNRSIAGSAGENPSFEKAKSTLQTQLIPLFQAEHDALAALKPPKEDAARMLGALQAMSSGINTIIGEVEAAKSKDALDSINPKGIAQWKTEVGNYGMSKCGSKTPSTT
jgi:hypothetical protein